MATLNEPNAAYSQLEVDYTRSYPEVVPSEEKEKAAQLTGGVARPQWPNLSFFIATAAIIGGVVGSMHHSGSDFHTCSNTDTDIDANLDTDYVRYRNTARKVLLPNSHIMGGYPHLEVFANTQNQTASLYRKYRGINSSDTTWYPNDGSLELIGEAEAGTMAQVSVASREVGYIDVWMPGSQAGYKTVSSDSPTIQWTLSGSSNWTLADSFASVSPGAVSWRSSRYDAIFLDSLNGLSWTNYIPTVFSWGPSRFDVFVVDSDTNQLYHAYFANATWYPSSVFESLGGYSDAS
ncbi:hypothetical protein BDZ45DRAFT_726184 [Acephala macrosclerotiorum]|nr:hypothetical protein BDZ45DRAFT_726184 [Acephala macrosclerotiorum]